MATNAYRVEPAKSSRAMCCACKNLIEKGDLRLGSPVQFGDHPVSYKWRHWECITPAVLDNIKGKIGRHGQEAALSGMDELKAKDKQRVRRWLDEGPSEAEEEEEEAPPTSSDEEEPADDSDSDYEEAPNVKTPNKPGLKRSARTAARRRAGGDDEDDSDYEPRPQRKNAGKRARK